MSRDKLRTASPSAPRQAPARSTVPPELSLNGDVLTLRHALEAAPKAIGPYSQAVVAGNMILTSAQIGLDPKTQAMVPGGIRGQTEQALKNLEAVLSGAGASFSDVVKVTIFVADLSDYAAVNEIYAKSSSKDAPARRTAQVTELPKLARVAIDMIAIKR